MDRCVDNPLAVVHAVANLERHAQAAGVSVSFKTDFREFVAVRQAVRPAETVTAMFDPQCTDDLSDGRRAFWVHGVDTSGETLSLQAARVDLFDGNFAQWGMSWMASLYHMRGDRVEPARWRPMSHSVAERISGRVAYHGEFWLAPEMRGSKGGGLLGILPRMCLLLIYVKWCPEFIWGVMTEGLAAHGGGARMGYTVQEPNVLKWAAEPEGASKQETLVCCDAKDLAYLAELECAST